MKAASLNLLLAALAVLALGNNEARANISIDLVNVGNAGNAPDPLNSGTIPGIGSVSYNYAIGQYDVTVGQYTAFLNAVAGTDTYGLYNTALGTDSNVLGISRSGSSGSYNYSVMGSANLPVTYVSWGDAARFSNWLQNGQPTGAQGNGTTETGAYTLNGATSAAALLAVTRNAGAIYWIPSENEWYKAAYYDPSLNGGTGAYWLYPTRSNTAPGNTIGSAPNNANYNIGVYSVTQNYLTNVGAFSGSASAYGTYDQGGNVDQWNDAVISGSSREIRGGAWANGSPFGLQSSSNINCDPTTESAIVGFRVASVPEPSTAGLVLLAGAGWMVWKRRKITL